MEVYKVISSKSSRKPSFLPVASIILTLIWPFLIFLQKEKGMNKPERRVHLAAMSTTGLLGITSVISVFRKSSKLSLFQLFLVLACVTGHGFLGVRSRKALQSNDKAGAIQYGLYQVILNIFAVLIRRPR